MIVLSMEGERMQVKKITMQKIADHLGVSKVSVSKAINNQTGVSEELKEKILDVAHSLGYPVEKQRRKRKSLKLAFIITKNFFIETDTFYSAIYYSIQQSCNKEKIALSLHIVGTTDETELNLPVNLSADLPDGIIIAGSMKRDYIEKLRAKGKPIVLVDFYYPLMQVDQVIVDNYNLSYEATNYLIKSGHKKIGFMGSLFINSSITDRFYGYLKALQEYNLEYNTKWHLPSLQEGQEHISNLINPESIPTAFVCHCDRAAYFLSLSLNYHKLKIPEDVSIISFDNTELAVKNHPPLTSIDIDRDKLALMALTMIKNRIENPWVKEEKMILRGELIIRESVGPCLT